MNHHENHGLPATFWAKTVAGYRPRCHHKDRGQLWVHMAAGANQNHGAGRLAGAKRLTKNELFGKQTYLMGFNGILMGYK